MTLAITLVTPNGVWGSTDHRLTTYPGGRLVTDSSVKHVVIRCHDGSALLSYTGLGRVGRLDVSEWMRGVLRGQSRTLDETLIDLSQQATACFGAEAKALGVFHVFLAGAFLGGEPWAVEIKNLRQPSAFWTGGIHAQFETAAIRVRDSVVMGAGSGWDAVSTKDRELLNKVSNRKPRNPEDFMRLLGDVNQRAADRIKSRPRSVSRSCTVVFMPPEGDGIQRGWYGPDEERHLAPVDLSHMLFGIDLGEVSRTILKDFQDIREGRISDEEFGRRVEKAGKKSVEPKGRHSGDVTPT
ncbi:hypothetical protein [Streptomyces sp. NPDC005485]|uniref:hypothetical protein n=1 Tax=Streptomyces sp. NPDC005485 TaxID=3155591 RepID=UPI0033B31714